MGLFHKAKAPDPPLFSLEEYEPVIRCSICTGEQVLCMRSRETGKLREVQLLRSEADLDDFCRRYSLTPEQIRKVY